MDTLGQVLKETRKFVGISQKDLALNICTQSFISRVEKGEVSPSADVLYKISERLGVDINHFFDFRVNPRYEYQLEVCNQIRMHAENSEYVRVEKIIKIEESNPLLRNQKMRQFFLWHKGLCEFYIRKNKDDSLSYLRQALKLGETTEKNYSEREIEILIAIGNIYNELKMYHSCKETYLEAILLLRRRSNIMDIKIYIRVINNYSKLLYRLNDYKASIYYAEYGINTCLNNNILYLLGDLYYQKGLSLIKESNKSDGLHNMKKSLTIFDIQRNEKYCNFVTKSILKFNKQN
jgi:transcriptional regulator with XRE-family HTH domain